MAGLPGEGSTFGRYDIGRRIGRGGMGVVFEATHRDLMRPVALKLLSMDLLDNEALRNRFIREAQALAAVDSPQIVPVFDAGEHDGWLYIATKLFPDGDLGDWIRDNGALAPGVAVSGLTQVADGLADAHDAGFLHRDIKPSNVLLQKRPDGLRAVICDFGIAFAEGNEHTKTVGVIGTLGYMAPERHEGQPATIASDIYSLGCVLYACLNGQAPWVGTDVKVAMGHLYEPVPQLADASPALNEVLARALAKDPAERYSSAQEFKEALQGLGAADDLREVAPVEQVDDSTVIVDFEPEAPTVLDPEHPAPAPLVPAVTATQTEVRPAFGEDPTTLAPAPVVAAETRPPAESAPPHSGPKWGIPGLVAAAVLLLCGLVAIPFVVGGDDEPAASASAETSSPSPTPTPTPTVAPVETPGPPVVTSTAGDLAVTFRFALSPTTPGNTSFEYRRVGGGAAWQPAYVRDARLRTSQGGERACILVRAIARNSSSMRTGPSRRACGRSKPKTLTLKLDGKCKPDVAGCTLVRLDASGLRRNVRIEIATWENGEPVDCVNNAGNPVPCFSRRSDRNGRLYNFVRWNRTATLTAGIGALRASVQVP